ncbi:MAG: LAGLIDADG family homing endonuclease [Solirubrobacterales bacterium]
MPPGGYPHVGSALGGFLAGFLEGEASFNITRQAGWANHRCRMTLCVRDDDRTLIASLAKATRIGSVTSQEARATSKPQVTWQVCAKSDCARLIEILDAYPLRGRKSYDYAIWRAAVRFWVADDPTRYEKNRDWEPMRYLKLQLSAARRFDPTRAPYEIREQHRPAKSDWNAYIAGLITADGSLAIVRNGQGYVPVVHITLRADDRPLLEAECRRAGAGTIYDQRGRKWAPSASWMVRDGYGLLKVTNLLDTERPRGRKLAEYAIWRRAVRDYASGLPRTEVRTRLSALRRQLAEIRRYKANNLSASAA